MPELTREPQVAASPLWPSRHKPLPRSFYLDSPDLVARNLLGKVLVRKAPGNAEESHDRSSAVDLAGRIIEVEAYFAGADPAAHAFAGKTARNAVLFGPPGHAYVYFIYGMYYCLNVSCEPAGQAGCVLIRALEPLAGLETMAERRQPKKQVGRQVSHPALLTSGPGRLCQAFGITRDRDNGADLTSRLSSLQIQDDGFAAEEVSVTRRIGITKAADMMARFVLAPPVQDP
jgi:DNA-3-methyladenine glycosylase